MAAIILLPVSVHLKIIFLRYIGDNVTVVNTHLLHAYSVLDERVAPLCQYINYWLKRHRINNMLQPSAPSSYTVYMMILHYLQVQHEHTCRNIILVDSLSDEIRGESAKIFKYSFFRLKYSNTKPSEKITSFFITK